MQKETQVGTVWWYVGRQRRLLSVSLQRCATVTGYPVRAPGASPQGTLRLPTRRASRLTIRAWPRSGTGRHDGPRRMTTEGVRVVIACDRDRARTHAVLLPLDY